MFEVPATLNKTWGYVGHDNDWKDAETVYKNLTDLNSKGINYLLNIGPDFLGRVPAPSVDILRKVGKMNKTK